MFKKLFSLFAALTLSAGLWADGSVFTYTATEKLESQFADLGTVASHDFNNGAGTVTYNGTVTEIGDYAFEECESLQSITIPAGVTTIGKQAFTLCFGLQSIDFPDNLTTLGSNAFFECESLQSITIPASVITIESYAFADCRGLTSVTFLGNACQEGIGYNAFAGVGADAPALLTLHGTWAKENLPDEDGNWYGGKFELSEDPTALPTLFGDGVKANKFLHNGQLIIRKGNKHFDALGQEVK